MKTVDRKQQQIESQKIDEALDAVIASLAKKLAESKKESSTTKDNRAEKAGKKVTKDMEWDDKHKSRYKSDETASERDAKAEKAGKKVAKDIEYDEKHDRTDEAKQHYYKGMYDADRAGKGSIVKRRRNAIAEESDDTRDDRAEKAGKKVTKDIEYDEKKKDGIHGKKRGSEDAKAERAGKKVAKDIEYDEKHHRYDESKSKKADKDYDGDGKIESPKDEVWGSRMRAAKKAGKMDEEKPSSGLSKEKKSSVAKKAHAGKDIGKKGKGFDAIASKAAKKYGSKEKGEKVAAAAMWKNIKREDASCGDEQLDELSPNTLGKYASKAMDMKRKASSDAHNSPDAAGFAKNINKANKRQLGLGKAVDRLSGGRIAGPRVMEEDMDRYDLDEKLNNLEDHLNDAVEAARIMMNSAKRSNPQVANYIKSYTLPWLLAWVDDPRQSGSVKALRDAIHDASEEELDEISGDLASRYIRKARAGAQSFDDVPEKRKQGVALALKKKHGGEEHGIPVKVKAPSKKGEEELDEKAVSKKQQKFMGMVHAAQKGEKPASKKVAKVAKSMKKGDVEDFASTKQKGLPEKKKKKAEESASGGSTSSGSVATSPSQGNKSSGGIQYGKSVYESFNEDLETMINAPETQEVTESVTTDDLTRMMETMTYINQKGNHNKTVLNEAMNFSVNVGTGQDGQPTKNITVTADGDDADTLARLLNLSGIEQAEPQQAEIEVVDENKPDWPTNTETSNDALQYSGGMNKPKVTGQTTTPVVASQTDRIGKISENVDLERTLFKLYQDYKGE